MWWRGVATRECARALAEVFQSGACCPVLKILVLQSWRLEHDADAKLVVESLAGRQELETLKMMRMGMRDGSATALMAILPSLPSLKELDITDILL